METNQEAFGITDVSGWHEDDDDKEGYVYRNLEFACEMGKVSVSHGETLVQKWSNGMQQMNPRLLHSMPIPEIPADDDDALMKHEARFRTHHPSATDYNVLLNHELRSFLMAPKKMNINCGDM
ncbi:hypothetical protein SARC_00931 [Sphaeroforma arctica JP610]|uniref:Uncharacterized protein n=1 Tax=Sphaeroforma arctica JP610 TaxID=667725 RepID=A0A0L0GDE3_9EUKA|nr:hypothetical protein SARC_00931 [Sphaeroforma arctica JP610]KNC86929.1 hypothetical protein SARC_00931 [Sphaeroforma arctica JP610]|eukprot:XP_014160831.1 hypothetical protein SARC_00931 [Sphaeroforma arctica JP610]